MTDRAPPDGRHRRFATAFILYAALAPSAAAALYISRGLGGGERRVGFLYALAWQAPVYLTWAALAPLILWVGRRYRLRRGGWLAPLPAYAVLSVPAVLGHAIFTAWLDWRMDPALAGTPIAGVMGLLVTRRMPVDLLLYWAIVGVVYAYEYNARLRAGEAAARQLEAELARAQLQALKMQLHPHFLFNALQTITILIPRDPGRAARVTVLLGDLLRTTLSRASSQLVPLRQEIELLRNYLAIEEVRFGDRLTFAIDVADDALDLCVPDLILQPHVENAIRHGLAPRPGPGTLTIRARRNGGSLRLEVEDDGVGMSARPGTTGFGIGHRITAERLRALFGEQHGFAAGPRAGGPGTLVSIELPARTASPLQSEAPES